MKKTKKLALRKESVRELGRMDLRAAGGAAQVLKCSQHIDESCSGPNCTDP